MDNNIFITNEKKYIIFNIIKNSPDTNAGLIFKTRTALINKDLKGAKINFDKLINKVTDKRDIILIINFINFISFFIFIYFYKIIRGITDHTEI